MAKNIFVLVLILTLAAYFGIGAWFKTDIEIKIHAILTKKPTDNQKYRGPDGLIYRNAEEMMTALYEEDVPGIWDWFGKLPYGVAAIVLAVAGGSAGGVLRTVWTLVQKKSGPMTELALGPPVMGAIVGILLLCVRFVIPFALTVEEAPYVRPTAIITLAFVGGFFPKQAYSWIEHSVHKFFKSDSEASK